MSAKLLAVNPFAGSRNHELAGYTGRIFEREVLGECRLRVQGYMSRNDSMKFVFNNQPYDPLHPPGEAGNFHHAVSTEMRNWGLKPAKLKLLTAVGSPLDWHYGIDGLFVFEGIMITLDCTINPYKDAAPRARVLVTGEDAVLGYPVASHYVAKLVTQAHLERRWGVV